jgi:hypothetical protein
MLYKSRRARFRALTPHLNLEFILVTAEGFALKLTDPLWKTRPKARSKKMQKVGTVSAMRFGKNVGKNARFNQLQWTDWRGSGGAYALSAPPARIAHFTKNIQLGGIE